MSGELQKPSYGATCNGCGLCCKLEICGVGEMALAETMATEGSA
jgi:uncharacterized cysteine cluster protein YcgN (CxxCxxCC family)